MAILSKNFRNYIGILCTLIACSEMCFATDKVEEKSSDVTQEKQADNSNDDTKVQSENEKSTITHIMEAISSSSSQITKIKPPFSDHPGFLEKLPVLDFTVNNMDTKQKFTLQELKDNVVVVFFTTTWCPNCPTVFRDLNDLADKLSDLGISNVKIVVLIIGNDSHNAIQIYYKMNNVQSLDIFEPISQFKGINGVPTVIILDKSGKSVWGFTGANNYKSQEILEFIVALSKEEYKEEKKRIEKK